MGRRRTRAPSFGAGLNQARAALGQFTRQTRQAARTSGEQWQLQQRANQELRREGLVTSLARYRFRSAALAAITGGAEVIGAGISGAISRGGVTPTSFISSEATTFAALRFARDFADVGRIFSEVIDPIQRATGRTGDVTTEIARYGGTVTPQLRETLFNLNLEQEKRVQQETRALRHLAESQETLGRALDETRPGGAADVLSVLVNEPRPTPAALNVGIIFTKGLIRAYF